MVEAQLPAEVQAAAKREGFSGAEYNAVAMEARLDTIKLLDLRLETHPDLPTAEETTELAFERQVKSCRHDPETGIAAAIFQFSVSVRSPAGEAFACRAEYVVLYAMPEDARPEAATSFCKHVGSFAAYPYFRALAAQMAWNAGIDLPPLPAIAAMPGMPKPPVVETDVKVEDVPGKPAGRGRNRPR